jgi:hypothetical protein
MTTVAEMTRAELRSACKASGIKYGKLSVMQMREVLMKTPEIVAEKTGTTKAAKKKVAKKGRKERTGTKMEGAIDVVAKNPNLPRKAIIALFIDKVGLTKAGANTYYALVTKKAK